MSVLNKINVISSLGYDCKICQKVDYKSQESIAGVFSTYAHSWLTCGPDLFIVNNSNGVLQSFWTFGENVQDDLEITCAIELPMEGCSIPLLILGIGSENTNLICFFNPNTRKILRTIDIIYPVRTICIVEDGTSEINPINDGLSHTEGIIAVGCAEGTILLIDLCRSILSKAINGDFRFCSTEENPSDTLYVDVDSVFSSGFKQQVHDSHRKKDSVSVILTEPTDEGITALLYSVEAAVLYAGTSSGSFQLWNMSSLKCLFKSPGTGRAIISMSLLEPCDDPRHTLYLWICFEEYAQVAMYCISFLVKFYVHGYGVYYQNFESAGLVYRFTLGMEVDLVAKRPISSQAVAKLVPKNLVRCISLPEAEGTQLRLFVTAYEIVDKGQSLIRAVIFDLNQWYREQMPDEGISSCLDSIDLDSKSLWHLQLDPRTLTLYQCVRPQEQHFHPTSFDFQVWCIEEEGIRCLEKLGLQSQWLRNMSRMGSKALLEPTRVFVGALAAGLLPSFIDPPDPEANNQVEERSFVLTVCLENRAILVIEDCAKEWNNGSHTVRGCTIQYLIDWLWSLHRIYKSNGNKICIPLFDETGMKFDISERRALQHCKSLLNIVQSVYANIVHKYRNILISGVEEKLTAMSLVRLYFDCCLKLITVNLLPEPNELGRPTGSVAYAYNIINEFVNNRRKEGPFLGDSLLGKTGAESQWEEEGGNGRYPPPSIQSVLRFCLHPSPSLANKMSLLLYLFMDIVNSYTPLRSQPVSERIKNFQHLMRISDIQYKIVAGCWYLDHSIFEEGIDLLLDPRVLSVDMSEDQHRDILSLLSSKGQEKLALQYLRLKSPSLHLPEDLRMELNLLLSNRLVNEAFLLQRRHPEMRETLLIEFFQGCIERKQLSQVFGLNLDIKEESVLMKYLKSSGLREKGDLQVLLLLSKAKYTEAMYLNDRLNSTVNGPKSKIESDTRDMIVRGITGSLNSISRQMAHEMKTYRPPPSGSAPQPLSTLIKVRNGPDGPLCQTDSNALLCAVAKSTRHLSDFVNSFESGHRRKRDEDEESEVEFDAPSRKRLKLCDTINGINKRPPLSKQWESPPHKPSSPKERDVMELVGTPLVKKHGKRHSPQSRPSSILKSKTPQKNMVIDDSNDTPRKSIRFALPDNDIITARKPLHENESTPKKAVKMSVGSEDHTTEKINKSKDLGKRVSGRKPLHGEETTINDISNIETSRVTPQVNETIKDRLRSSVKKQPLKAGVNWNAIAEATTPRVLFSTGSSRSISKVKSISITSVSSTPLSQALLDITVTSDEKKYIDSPSRSDEASPVTEAIFNTTALPKTLFSSDKNEKELEEKSTDEILAREAFLENYRQLRNKCNKVKSTDNLIKSSNKNLDLCLKENEENSGNTTQRFNKTFEGLDEKQLFSLSRGWSLDSHNKITAQGENKPRREGSSLVGGDVLKKDVTNDVLMNRKLLQLENILDKKYVISDDELKEESLLHNEQMQKIVPLENEELQEEDDFYQGDLNLLKNQEEESEWSDLKLIRVEGNFSVEKSNDTLNKGEELNTPKEKCLSVTKKERGNSRKSIFHKRESTKNSSHRVDLMVEEIEDKIANVIDKSVEKEEVGSEDSQEDIVRALIKYNLPEAEAICEKETINKKGTNDVIRLVSDDDNEEEGKSNLQSTKIHLIDEEPEEEFEEETREEDKEKQDHFQSSKKHLIDEESEGEFEEETSEEEKEKKGYSQFSKKHLIDEEPEGEFEEETSEEEKEKTRLQSSKKNLIDEEPEGEFEEETGEEFEEEIEEEEDEEADEEVDDDENGGSMSSDVSSEEVEENSDESNSDESNHSLLPRTKSKPIPKQEESEVVICLDDSEDEDTNDKQESNNTDSSEQTEYESKNNTQDGEQYDQDDISDSEVFGLKCDKKDTETDENSEDDIWAGLHSETFEANRVTKNMKSVVHDDKEEKSQDSESPEKDVTKLLHKTINSELKPFSVNVEDQTTLEIQIQPLEKKEVSVSYENIQKEVNKQNIEYSVPLASNVGLVDDSVNDKFINHEEIETVSSLHDPSGDEKSVFDYQLPLIENICNVDKQELFAEVSRNETVSDLKEDFQTIERNWTEQIENEMKQDNVLFKNIEHNSNVQTGIVQLLDNDDISSIGDLKPSKNLKVHEKKLDKSEAELVPDSLNVSTTNEIPIKVDIGLEKGHIDCNIPANGSSEICRPNSVITTTKEKNFIIEVEEMEADLDINEDLIKSRDIINETSLKYQGDVVSYNESNSEKDITVETEIIGKIKQSENDITLDNNKQIEVGENFKISNIMPIVEVNDNKIVTDDISHKSISESNNKNVSKVIHSSFVTEIIVDNSDENNRQMVEPTHLETSLEAEIVEQSQYDEIKTKKSKTIINKTKDEIQESIKKSELQRSDNGASYSISERASVVDDCKSFTVRNLRPNFKIVPDIEFITNESVSTSSNKDDTRTTLRESKIELEIMGNTIIDDNEIPEETRETGKKGQVVPGSLDIAGVTQNISSEKLGCERDHDPIVHEETNVYEREIFETATKLVEEVIKDDAEGKTSKLSSENSINVKDKSKSLAENNSHTLRDEVAAVLEVKVKEHLESECSRMDGPQVEESFPSEKVETRSETKVFSQTVECSYKIPDNEKNNLFKANEAEIIKCSENFTEEIKKEKSNHRKPVDQHTNTQSMPEILSSEKVKLTKVETKISDIKVPVLKSDTNFESSDSKINSNTLLVTKDDSGAQKTMVEASKSLIEISGKSELVRTETGVKTCPVSTLVAVKTAGINLESGNLKSCQFDAPTKTNNSQSNTTEKNTNVISDNDEKSSLVNTPKKSHTSGSEVLKQEISFSVDKNESSDSEPVDELNNAKMDISNDSLSDNIKEKIIKETKNIVKEREDQSETCSEVLPKLSSEKTFFFGKEDIDTYIRSTKATFQVGSRLSLPNEDEPVDPMDIAMIENEDKFSEQASQKEQEINLTLQLSPEHVEKPQKVDQGMVTQNSYLQRRARRIRNSKSTVNETPNDNSNKEIKNKINIETESTSCILFNVEREYKCISTQTSETVLDTIELSESEEEEELDTKGRYSKAFVTSQQSAPETDLKTKDRRKMRQSSEPPGIYKEDKNRKSPKRTRRSSDLEKKQSDGQLEEVGIKGILKNRNSTEHRIDIDNSDTNRRSLIRRSRRLSEQHIDRIDSLKQNDYEKSRSPQTLEPTFDSRIHPEKDVLKHQRRSTRGCSEDPDMYRTARHKEKEGMQKHRSRRQSEEPELQGILKNPSDIQFSHKIHSTRFSEDSDLISRRNKYETSSSYELRHKFRDNFQKCSEEAEIQGILKKKSRVSKRSSHTSETAGELNLRLEDFDSDDNVKFRRLSEEQVILKRNNKESKNSYSSEADDLKLRIGGDFSEGNKKLRRHSEDLEVHGLVKKRRSVGRRSSQSSETISELKHLQDDFHEGGRRLRRHSEEPQGILKKNSKVTRKSSHYSGDNLRLNAEEDIIKRHRILRRHSEEPEIRGILKKSNTNKRRSSCTSETAGELKRQLEEVYADTKKKSKSTKSSHAEIADDFQLLEDSPDEKDGRLNDTGIQIPRTSKQGKKRGYSSRSTDTTHNVKSQLDETEETRKSHKLSENSDAKSVFKKPITERELKSSHTSSTKTVVTKESKDGQMNVSDTDAKCNKEIKHSRKSLLISKYKDDMDYQDNIANKHSDANPKIEEERIPSQKPEELTENKNVRNSHPQVFKEAGNIGESSKIAKCSIINTDKSLDIVSIPENLRKCRRKTPEKINVDAKIIEERKRMGKSDNSEFIPKRLEYSDDESPDKKKSRSLIDFPIRRNSRLPRPTLDDIREEEEDDARVKKKTKDDLHIEQMKKKHESKKFHSSLLEVESDVESDISTPELWKKEFTKDKRLTRTQQKLFLKNQQLTAVSEVVGSSSAPSSPRRSTRKKADMIDSPSKTPTRSSLRLQKKPPSETE